MRRVRERVRDLVGTFVVEVGERQAWPFVTFCNNDPTPPVETRLYIDTDYSLAGAASLGDLMSLEVDTATVEDAALLLTFTGGAMLDISGVANATTSHDVWWLGSA